MCELLGCFYSTLVAYRGWPSKEGNLLQSTSNRDYLLNRSYYAFWGFPFHLVSNAAVDTCQRSAEVQRPKSSYFLLQTTAASELQENPRYNPSFSSFPFFPHYFFFALLFFSSHVCSVKLHTCILTQKTMSQSNKVRMINCVNTAMLMDGLWLRWNAYGTKVAMKPKHCD